MAGTLAASITHGLTLAENNGGWLGISLHTFNSGMGQAFMIAIIAWSTCFLTTIAISLGTTSRKHSELIGLVYSLTPKQVSEPGKWFQSEKTLAVIILILMAIVSFILR